MSPPASRPSESPLWGVLAAFGAVYVIWGSTCAFVNPLIAVLLGCTIGREPFTSELVLAAALIVVAVALIVSSGLRRRKIVAECLQADPALAAKPPVPCLGSETK